MRVSPLRRFLSLASAAAVLPAAVAAVPSPASAAPSPAPAVVVPASAAAPQALTRGAGGPPHPSRSC